MKYVILKGFEEYAIGYDLNDITLCKWQESKNKKTGVITKGYISISHPHNFSSAIKMLVDTIGYELAPNEIGLKELYELRIGILEKIHDEFDKLGLEKMKRGVRN